MLKRTVSWFVDGLKMFEVLLTFDLQVYDPNQVGAHQKSQSQERVKKKSQHVQELMWNQIEKQANSPMAQQTAEDTPEF